MNSRDILAKLVGFNTTSHLSNLELIDWVEAYLSEFGIQGTRVPSPDGLKSNFYATIGPEAAGGIILSGHSDVVPVDGQTWHTDPFDMTERGGKLYGRGTCDMKGFVACALAAVPQMAQLKRPIHIALSYDEEVGCQGVLPMVTDIAGKLPPIDAVIVGEPTMMSLVTGHKGIFAATTTVTGTPAHSSQTQLGVSAVHVASTLIGELLSLAKDLQAPQEQDDQFDPPYSTVTVNQINGGTALNILAEHCSFSWDTRAIDVGHTDKMLVGLARVAEDLKSDNPHIKAIETEVVTSAPGLSPQDENAAEELVKRLTGANSVGAAAFATEAGHFQSADFDTVVYGPGDIAQAHQPDEFIALSQLDACDAFLAKLIQHLS